MVGQDVYLLNIVCIYIYICIYTCMYIYIYIYIYIFLYIPMYIHGKGCPVRRASEFELNPSTLNYPQPHQTKKERRRLSPGPYFLFSRSLCNHLRVLRAEREMMGDVRHSAVWSRSAGDDSFKGIPQLGYTDYVLGCLPSAAIPR